MQQTRTRAILAIVGGVLVHLTLGTLYTLGNLAPYLASYLRANHPGTSVRPQTMPWIFAMAASGQSASMWLGGPLREKLGVRGVVSLGCALTTASVAVTYWSVEQFSGQILTLGVSMGLGVGLAYATPLVNGMAWYPNHRGFVSGVIVAGFGGGAFVFDQIQTAYINPHNEKVVAGLDPHHPKDKYFPSNSIVVERTPDVMLLLAAIYLVMQIIGIGLLFSPNDPQNSHGETDDKLDLRTTASLRSSLLPKTHEYTPKQAARTKTFWQLWMMFLLNNQMVVFTSTMFKVYGEARDLSDHYLAMVGALSALFNGLGRMVWGVLTDKFGFRYSMSALQLLLIIVMLTWTISDHHAPGSFGSALNTAHSTNAALFAVWVCIIFFCIGGNYSMFPAATTTAFGTEHATTTYGLVFTANVISNIIGAALSSELQGDLEWGFMTVLVAALVGLGFLVNMFCDVHEPQKMLDQ